MNTKTTFLKTMLFAITTSMTLQAQDTSAYLHVQFENNLNATTTNPAGVTFEVTDPNSEGSLIKYSSSSKQEGSFALDFSSYAFDDNGFTDNASIIDNSSNVQIQSTTDMAILGNAARTFAAWVRVDNISTAGGSHVILNMGNPTSSTQGRVTWTIQANNNVIQIAIGGGNVSGNVPASIDIQDNNWHHVAFTYAGGTTLDDVIFYVDGVASTNDGGNSDNPFNTVADLLTIGSRGNNTTKWFDGGGIDDLRVYDYALSSTQITTIYGGGSLSSADIAFAENEIKTSANPVEDILSITTTNNSSLDIDVIDITGKILVKTHGNSVDMGDLASGLYIVKVREDNKIANLKIVKK